MSIVRNRLCSQCHGLGRIQCNGNKSINEAKCNLESACNEKQKAREVIYAPEDVHKFGLDSIRAQEEKVREQLFMLSNAQQQQSVIASDAKASLKTCSSCNSTGVTPCEALLVFHIQGKQHGHTITFPCQGDQVMATPPFVLHQCFSSCDVHKDTIPGDVIVVLHEIPHGKFVREGVYFECVKKKKKKVHKFSVRNNLFMKKKINLVDALGTGYKFAIVTPDRRLLRIHCDPICTIEPYSIKCIPNEGVPDPWQPTIRGHLFVQFEVVFPKVIPPQLRSVSCFTLTNIFVYVPF
ncbi:DNAJ like chaperone [Reticulomyxa filosa]|uniref:DNAJ like chaperone n=1 Tax=Reticulomyxa filosa TaxID=46433 RepID=X6LKW4_RETFI|nr:DNAJ like chaperone [Reticulomyxa filosa]|eukprot:ETO01996.1 DNAJ like chaperone [Reticulomyxa filosa]